MGKLNRLHITADEIKITGTSMSREYSPDIVAQSFIKQFYEMLAKNPGELHRFYKEESFFTHSEGQQVTNAVQGVESIRKRVGELNLAGARVDLTEGSVDAQRSDNNGVFLVVTGEFTQPDTVPRRFVQTFFLSASVATNTANSTYFVRNSVFRLLGPAIPTASVSTQSFTALSVDATTSTAAQAASPVIEVLPVHNHFPVAVHHTPLVVAPAPVAVVVVEEPVAIEEEPVLEEEEVEEIVVPEPVPVAASAPVSPVIEKPVAQPEQVAAAAVPAPAVASVSKTYSDMVKKLLAPNGAASSAPAAPTSAAVAPIRPATVPRKAAQPSSSVATATTSGGDDAHHGGSSGAGRSSNSGAALYVKQLPEDATEAELRAIFGPFGVIKSVNTHSGRNFAFVEFETDAGLKAVLESGSKSFDFRGTHTVKVEERNAGRSSGGGDRNRSSSGGGGDKNKSGGGANGGNRGGNRGGDNKQGGGGRNPDGTSSDNKGGRGGSGGGDRGQQQQRREGGDNKQGGERRGGGAGDRKQGGGGQSQGQRNTSGGGSANGKVAAAVAGDANRQQPAAEAAAKK